MSTPLIEPMALAKIIKNEEVIVFDCRHQLTDPSYGREQFLLGHLPGAIFASIDDHLSGVPTGDNGRHPLPRVDDLRLFLEKNGVSNSTTVVCYDDAGGVYASRLWWLLRWLGHEGVLVLNGGIQGWTSMGQRLEIIERAPRSRQTLEIDLNDVHVDADYILGKLQSEDLVIIDARANDRFRGKNETIDPVAGHIPGAINRFFKANLDETGQMKGGNTLREEFLDLIGSENVTNVVHQCGSGVSACHNLLAMEVAGLVGSKLYPGSWSEWISDKSRPISQLEDN
jgi:thiosulfate/3-mercaptopyruvate sulfurtransferase